MQLKCLQLTTAGDREVNQDAMTQIIDKEFGLFVVADGLGGHRAGEKASSLFCQAMQHLAGKYGGRLAQNPIKMMMDWVDEAIDEMRRLFADDPAAVEAHTTCAVLYIDNTNVVTAHCGDSRIYRINIGQVLWRTKDHSVPQQLLNLGAIAEHEMGLHPEQNQLTRSINIRKTHSAEIKVYPPMKLGETFILCSDGFWEHVKQSELLELALPESGKEELGKIARLSVLRAKGRSDNVTVQRVSLGL